ncbi:PAS domain S-box protein [Pontibacter korlensis]|nr:PAS domain S-box protein [Pontibacter korlensis]
MNESPRLHALDSYQIMDTLPQEEFDDITELASIICGTPISLITFLDSKRQWFKSRVGLDISETSRGHAFCHYAIQFPDEVTMVEDSFQDERFRDNPLVTGDTRMRFYAGAPLITPDGHALGSLCVIDHEPRTLTNEQQRALRLLSKRVVERLELRKTNLKSEQMLRSSDHKLLALTEQSPNFIGVLNDSLAFTYVNKGYDGASSEELVGRSALDGLYNEFREEFVIACKEVLQSGNQAKLKLKLKAQSNDEKWVSCRLSPLKSDTGMLSSILMTGTDITEQLKTEASEKESRAYYESLFFSNPNAVARISLDGILEDINDSTVRIYGYTKEEAVGQHFMTFVDPAFALDAAEAFTKTLEGQPSSFEGKALRKGGVTIDVMVTVVPVIVDGEVRKLQIVTNDITEVKRAQNLIMEQAEAQSAIFESVSEGFLALDRNMSIIYLNNVCASFLRKSKEELLHKPLFELFPNLESSALFTKCQEVNTTGTHVHFRETFPLSKKTLDIDVYQTQHGIAIHFLDVTDKVVALEDYGRMYYVASRIKNSVLVLNSDETIAWANESFLNLLGVALNQAQGSKVSELLDNGNVNLGAVTSFRERLKGEAFLSDEIEIHTREGQRLWLQADVTSALDEHGMVKQYFVILSDHTQLKETKDELRQQADQLFLQNKDLQEFTYIVSHNLRAPVANILGVTSLLGRVDRNSAAFDTSLDYLRTSATQLDTVLKDMNVILSIRDRRDIVEKEPVSLAEVWQQVSEDLREPLAKCGARVTVDIQEGLCASGLKAHVYSVFHNLLSNAVKYRSGERALHIRLKCFGSSDKGVVVSFSDNGSGFDKKKAGDNIFKLYKRFHTNKEGRGIGLYLVKTHVEAMGGRIYVESQLNVGTRFLIYLN